MKILIDPAPCDPPSDYTIEVSGGTPPYAFDPYPDPPGVTVQVNGNVATVTVPPGTPPGSEIKVQVSDASQPPESSPTVNVIR